MVAGTAALRMLCVLAHCSCFFVRWRHSKLEDVADLGSKLRAGMVFWKDKVVTPAIPYVLFSICGFRDFELEEERDFKGT
ncbi:hypothetical protein OPV22_015134 [Ensete ventricosum]|uniref:Secreted protein n=1 Tax=Ensete ventricosum TaxID=4639 RepID=A0AAV8R4V6_ENSVE|nr:hypothetical protein OPV22_015134 [Ensete ventricosum]